MKLLKLIFISACLLAFSPIIAQEAETSEAYYTYELWHTGKVKNESDTLFQVILLLDTTDIDRYTCLFAETSNLKKELKIDKEDRENNSRITLKTKNYHLDMEEWVLNEELIVFALKLDGSRVKLMHHPRASEFYHKLEATDSGNGNLKVYDETKNSENLKEN